MDVCPHSPLSLEEIKLSDAYRSTQALHDGGIVVERVFRQAMDTARKQGWDQGVQEGDAEWVKKYDSMKLAAHKYRAKAKVRAQPG